MREPGWLPTRGFLNLEWQSRLLEGKKARATLLILVCLLIPLWQYPFYTAGARLDDTYRNRSSSGLLAQMKFLYFYYYLGWFPVATEREDLPYSQAGAREFAEKHGDALLMEWGHSFRSGSLGNVLLYLPDALLKGSPRNPSVRPCHAIAFIVALEAVFVAFWFIRQPILGMLLVLLFGSDPFQLYEVYAHENTFGWPITAALLALAVHVPLLAGRKVPRYYLWATPIVTGLFLAATRQVRPEPAVIIVSAAACYLLLPRARWFVRAGLLAALTLSLWVGLQGWSAYFNAKYNQARRAVEAAGGHPYPGPRSHHHLFWHPIWCGLGDFDHKHGYVWDDQVAADYALPILERKYGVEVPRASRTRIFFENTHWDAEKNYYRMPYELPHYEDAVREKVLHDITHDPLWYLGILAQRVWRVLWTATPLRLGFGTFWVGLPMYGILLLPVLALLAVRRCWWLVKLACFPLAASLPAVLIFSGLGMCYYSCYHLVAAALLVAWVIEAVLRRTMRPPSGGTIRP